jgi:hypothetical protein
MLITYLVVLWLILTVMWMGNKKLRRSAAVFILWFVVTAVVLWPVSRRVAGSPVVKGVVDAVRVVGEEIGGQFEEELRGELEREFGI